MAALCDALPNDFKTRDEIVVTVTPPAGTLHEAFFDPVTMGVGVGVGVDGSNGVIKPDSFTVGRTATSITELKWEAGSVVLALSPHASLLGQEVEFIELDGTVGLSLEGSNAVEDPATGTHTRNVVSQPWDDGDLLMLRISEAAPPPTPTPDPTTAVTVTLAPRTESYGTVTTVTVGWTDTMSCDFEYLVGLYDDQVDVNEHDCSPNPFDLMAIQALYQTVD